MDSPRRPRIRPRYRVMLAYLAVAGSGCAILVLLWPAQRWGLISSFAIGLLAAWTVAALASRHCRRRLHRLRETADAIGRGDLSQTIEHPPHDDFVKLADSLERMFERLQATSEEKDQLREQLTRNEKLALIGELAATLAHEINNPLDGLQNSARIIRRHPDNHEQTRRLLDMMETGLYRIEMIVRRLLTMSRDEPIHPEPVRLDEMVNDALLFVNPKLGRSGIELVRDMPEQPVFAKADREQMVQVLINLMINAADSMHEGGTLTIRCRAKHANGCAAIEVIDTGAGIDPDHLPHIFEPFYTTKPQGGGTGLGLAVAARIIKAHQGTIEVDSQPERGTRFRIELPALGDRAKEKGDILLFRGDPESRASLVAGPRSQVPEQVEPKK